VAVLLSRCRELQAEAAAGALSAQRAERAAAELQTQLTAAQQDRCAVQERYKNDMAALESTAREQLSAVQAAAAERAGCPRRGSSSSAAATLQERLGRRLTGAAAGARPGGRGSLFGSTEVEELRAGVAQQAQQVEAREAALAGLIAQLNASLGGGGGAAGAGAAGAAGDVKIKVP
jgi:hypothetical protein